MDIKHCFIIASAINTHYSVYNTHRRWHQTLDTISSINLFAPGSQIILVEMSSIALTPDQKSELSRHVTHLVDFSQAPAVTEIYRSTKNWDIIKNQTEITMFERALSELEAQGHFDNVTRIHKISGRYRLNDEFDLSTYELAADKIVLSQMRESQFDPRKTKNQLTQYMSRLWSWPQALTPLIIKFYQVALADFVHTRRQAGYRDIEHLLARHLPQEHLHEVEVIGVEGAIGTSGQRVSD